MNVKTLISIAISIFISTAALGEPYRCETTTANRDARFVELCQKMGLSKNPCATYFFELGLGRVSDTEYDREAQRSYHQTLRSKRWGNIDGTPIPTPTPTLTPTATPTPSP